MTSSFVPCKVAEFIPYVTEWVCLITFGSILTFFAAPCYNNIELNDSKALTKTEIMVSLTESRGEVEAR